MGENKKEIAKLRKEERKRIAESFERTEDNEKNSHCYTCSSALDPVEAVEYRGSCLFCGVLYKKITWWEWMTLCRLDWKIYRMKQLLNTSCLNPFEIQLEVTAALATVGFSRITQAGTVVQKKEVIKALRSLIASLL